MGKLTLWQYVILGPLKGGQGGTEYPRPGFFLGARAVVTRNTKWFLLSCAFYWSRHLDPAIADTAISIWLSLISIKIRLPTSNRSVCESFTSRFRQI